MNAIRGWIFCACLLAASGAHAENDSASSVARAHDVQPAPTKPAYAAIGASLDDVDTVITPPANGGSAEEPSTAPASHVIPPGDGAKEQQKWDEPVERRWYGLPTLLLDSIAIGLMGGAVASERGGYLGAGGILYVITGPAVHGAHHRGGAALASLALRVGLPLIGAGAGAASHCEGDDFCAVEGAARGMLGGAIVASVIDIGALSWERVDESGESAAVQWSVSPIVDAKTGSKGLSVVGTF